MDQQQSSKKSEIDPNFGNESVTLEYNKDKLLIRTRNSVELAGNVGIFTLSKYTTLFISGFRRFKDVSIVIKHKQAQLTQSNQNPLKKLTSPHTKHNKKIITAEVMNFFDPAVVIFCCVL